MNENAGAMPQQRGRKIILWVFLILAGLQTIAYLIDTSNKIFDLHLLSKVFVADYERCLNVSNAVDYMICTGLNVYAGVVFGILQLIGLLGILKRKRLGFDIFALGYVLPIILVQLKPFSSFLLPTEFLLSPSFLKPLGDFSVLGYLRLEEVILIVATLFLGVLVYRSLPSQRATTTV